LPEYITSYQQFFVGLDFILSGDLYTADIHKVSDPSPYSLFYNKLRCLDADRF